jgi:hypothetical protein
MCCHVLSIDIHSSSSDDVFDIVVVVIVVVFVAFVVVVARYRYVFGCKVACYTHYPTISTDMLGLVERREQSYNNNPIISRSPLLSGIKLVYYRLFAVAYGAVGRCAHSAMSNSSWTAAHVSIHFIHPSDCKLARLPCLFFARNPDRAHSIELNWVRFHVFDDGTSF